MPCGSRNHTHEEGEGMKEERLASGGAILAAIAASLCCLAPLVFVVLGLGAFGAAAFFETARPYLLGAAVVLLAFGFYRSYFRPAESCAPDGTCIGKPINRASRVILWIAAAGVIAFALSPYYAGALARHLVTKPATPETNKQAAAAKPVIDSVSENRAGTTNGQIPAAVVTLRVADAKDTPAEGAVFLRGGSAAGGWSVRQLERQIRLQFYERTAHN